jgi:hypothetical protein
MVWRSEIQGHIYFTFGYTNIDGDGEERTKCLLCTNVFEQCTLYVERTPEFFHRKLNEFNKQKQAYTKNITTITVQPLLALFEAAYRIAKCRKLLPSATHTVVIILQESYAIELRKIPLVDNTVGGRISDISEDLVIN